jgi:putative zinc finger/helix-turn-helix YgiT family protein
MNCPMCGKNPIYSTERYHYRESGLDHVFVSGVSIYRCKCGEEYVQLPGVDNIHSQIALELLLKQSLLTGPESRFLRKWLGLKSEELAKALGYTRVTVSRWENEGPSANTDRSLRLYASVTRSIAIDFVSLFSTIKDKPEKNFRIEVDGALPHLPSSSDVSETASAIASAAESLELRPFASYVTSQAVASTSFVLDSSVIVSGTATVSLSAKSIIDMLTNFDKTLSMPTRSIEVTSEGPDKAANQELAQAA